MTDAFDIEHQVLSFPTKLDAGVFAPASHKALVERIRDVVIPSASQLLS